VGTGAFIAKQSRPVIFPSTAAALEADLATQEIFHPTLGAKLFSKHRLALSTHLKSTVARNDLC
jgi:hypothetical protein